MNVPQRPPLTPESVDRAIARLAAARHGVFSRTEALRAGATDRMIRQRLATGRWDRLHPAVYRLAGAPPSWRQALLAACLGGGEGAVASHRAAAGLFGLSGIDPGAVEITVPRGRRYRRAGVVAHETRRLPRVDVTVADRIPATSPARTLIDLSAVVEPDVLEEALDDALRSGLVSLPRLRWRMSELKRCGLAGIAVMRSLLDARGPADAVPASVLETRLLRLLTRAGLPAPVCQHPIREAGKLLAVVDFAYPAVRLAIEAEGYRYHSGRAKWRHDLSRRNSVTSRGWRVMHVTADDLETRPHAVCRTLARALASGAATGGR